MVGMKNKRRTLLMTLLSIFPLMGISKISAQEVEKLKMEKSELGPVSYLPPGLPSALEISVPEDHVLLVLHVGNEVFKITAKEALEIMRGTK